ncbi:hypothetical protein YQE_06401, partial [Dendroctonus ponderosae]
MDAPDSLVETSSKLSEAAQYLVAKANNPPYFVLAQFWYQVMIKMFVEKGHECKATHRISEPVFLRFGPCRSRKRFRPKYCGLCPLTGTDCQPTLSTTVNVDFICEGKRTAGNSHGSRLQSQKTFLNVNTGMFADNFQGLQNLIDRVTGIRSQYELVLNADKIQLPIVSKRNIAEDS